MGSDIARWGRPWWWTNVAISLVLNTTAKEGGIFFRGRIFFWVWNAAQEKLNGKEAFASCKGKGRPKRLQKEVENILHINTSGPAKVRKLSSCCCLLAIWWNYGQISLSWFSSQQSGVWSTSVGSGELQHNHRASSWVPGRALLHDAPSASILQTTQKTAQFPELSTK